ncbi:tRNA (Thr-GGU) A37 N-methylase [Bradyrhizobium elkanii]
MPNAVSVATAKLIRVIATGLGMNIKPADAVKRLPVADIAAFREDDNAPVAAPRARIRIPGGQCTKASISAKVTSA